MFTPFLVFFVFFATCANDECKSEFAGKVVFVTGGSSGIGYQTALQFAQAGAYVGFVARDSHPNWYTGAEAETKINSDATVKENGGKAMFIKADASIYEEIIPAINKVYDTFGGLDIACNVAGIGGPIGFSSGDPALAQFLKGEHDPIMNNVYHVINAMNGELNLMNKTQKGGRIINLSSYNGIRACPTCALYSASKHAIIGLTQSAALEYQYMKPAIRINSIGPGLIDTPLTRNQVTYFYHGEQTWEGPLVTETDPDWIKMKQTLYNELTGHRLGQPSEIADVIMFLASEKSSFANGENFPIDFASSAK